jgi:putative aldouronate transport system substrate-binding protein
VVANVHTLFGIQLESEKDRFGTILSILDEICNRDYRTHLTKMWGFEGEHWTMNDDETITRSADNATIQALGGVHTFRLNVNTEFATKELGPPIKWAEDHGFTVGNAKHEVFVGLPSAGKYQTELNKIRDEMIVSIITGDRPISFFDEYVKQWSRSGGEVLTEEANAWYKDFWGL